MVLETRLATFETVSKTDQKKKKTFSLKRSTCAQSGFTEAKIHSRRWLVIHSVLRKARGRVGGVNLLVSGESLTSCSQALSTGAGAEPI